jgi:hypothetical protein
MTPPELPCRLVLPDGRVSCRDRPPEGHVRAYLHAVVAPQDDIARYMEFPRGRRVNGELEVARWPRGNFHDPGDRLAIYEHVMRRLERADEMFCGPVPRTEPKPRKDVVEAGRVLWVDIDRKSAASPPRWPTSSSCYRTTSSPATASAATAADASSIWRRCWSAVPGASTCAATRSAPPEPRSSAGSGSRSPAARVGAPSLGCPNTNRGGLI